VPRYHAPWGPDCFLNLTFPRSPVIARRQESLRWRERMVARQLRDADDLYTAISNSHHDTIDRLEARERALDAREAALDLSEQAGIAVPLPR
jgi:hypothetical protein